MPDPHPQADRSCTIVPSAQGRHKYRPATLALLLGVISVPVAAQQVETSQRVTADRVVSMLSAAAVYVAPHLLELNAGPPECAPCDRATVPAFDRWIIRPELPTVSHGSTFLLGAVGGIALLDLARGPDGARRALSAVEATTWALGLAELAKALIDRNRPVLYTDGALAEAAAITNQRSMPSGHTAAAFALATSYWLSRTERDPWLRAAALLGAVGVGALRVVAARHFPSDVVVGAGVGIASALVVHEIRF